MRQKSKGSRRFSLRKSSNIRTTIRSFSSQILASDWIGLDWICLVLLKVQLQYYTSMLLLQLQQRNQKRGKWRKNQTHFAHTKTTIYSEIKHLTLLGQREKRITVYYLSLILQMLFTQLFKQRIKKQQLRCILQTATKIDCSLKSSFSLIQNIDVIAEMHGFHSTYQIHLYKDGWVCALIKSIMFCGNLVYHRLRLNV